MPSKSLTTYLCEKPSQANDVAKFLGLSSQDRKKNHFINHAKKIAVVNAVGHLFELATPETFVPELAKSWSLKNLPVFPDVHHIVLKKGNDALFNTIKSVFKQSKCVVIATDSDNEGELIARDIIAQTGFEGEVKRVLYSSTDDKALKKSFSNLIDAKETLYMAKEADLRRRLDWLIGMNLTMAMTHKLRVEQEISKGSFPVGRVITCIALMVLDLERRINAFVPKNFYNVDVNCKTEKGIEFIARLQIPEQYLDENGHCTSKKVANSFKKSLIGKQFTVNTVESLEKREKPPLPFDLSALQSACDKFGIEADETLQCLQALYDKPHSLVTYPRTDCKYLPEGMLAQVPATIKQLNSLREVRTLDVDLSKQPRSFDDKKVAIHHGIIPTTKSAALNKLTEKQLIVYLTIVVRYVMQFMNDYRYFSQSIIMSLKAVTLKASSIQVIDSGWKKAAILEGKERVSGTVEIEVNESDVVTVVGVSLVEGITKPPSRLTTATLVAAMEKPHSFVADDAVRALVKKSNGIGTPATRSDGVKKALTKNLIVKKGKFVVPSKLFEKHAGKFQKFSPGFTALIQRDFTNVVKGKTDENEFFNMNKDFINKVIEEWQR